MAHLAVAEPCHVPLPVGVAAAYVEHLWAPRRRSGVGNSTRDDATLSYLPIYAVSLVALFAQRNLEAMGWPMHFLANERHQQPPSPAGNHI